MKRLTIGRNANCDIVFDQNMVSRNHALLNIHGGGKYEIVNMGANGTKVNGTLISSGQPYPVKRGDSIVFAGQCHLDWNMVPKSTNPWKILGWILAVIAVLALVGFGVWYARQHYEATDTYGGEASTEYVDEPTPRTPADTIGIKSVDEPKAPAEESLNDMIKRLKKTVKNKKENKKSSQDKSAQDKDSKHNDAKPQHTNEDEGDWQR